MKKKILIIDDDASIRDILTRLLVMAGYETIAAAEGREALDILATSMVDLIMLDMNMPTMDGIAFLRALRQKNVTRIPVLMVSGESDVEQIVECYKLGVYDFIRKPEQTAVMLKRVENGLKIGEMISFNEFIKVELLMARKLQKYLFPEGSYSDDFLEVSCWSRPLSDIGGDLYDYIRFRDGRVMFFVADVSGHSISAALYTAIVNMVFRNALQQSENPGDILSSMNHELSGTLPVEAFVTMFCGILNPATRELVFANAGHPRPFLSGDGGVSELVGNDSFLSPISNARYTSHHVTLRPGDALYIYTDGLSDIINSAGEAVGRSLLLEILGNAALDHRGRFDEVQRMALRDDVVINDDCTLMMVRIKES